MTTELIPVQGYPGRQVQQECEECSGPLEIKDIIWDMGTEIRSSLRCSECGNIQVHSKERRMYRYRMTIRRGL